MSTAAIPATAGTGTAFLRIEDVVKDFGGGAVAVNHVSIDIAKGEIFALLGSSGCGKTTLLRMLAGFETPTSGRILLEGQDIAPLTPYERRADSAFARIYCAPIAAIQGAHHVLLLEPVAGGVAQRPEPAPDDGAGRKKGRK